MKTQWLGKNVNLSMLCENLEAYFLDIDFETTVEKVPKGFMIQAVSEIPVHLDIAVNILGASDNFTVEFVAGGKSGFFSMLIGYLTSMFGGGYIILREAERREALDKVEKMFLRHLQMLVADLANSAINMKRGTTKLTRGVNSNNL